MGKSGGRRSRRAGKRATSPSATPAGALPSQQAAEGADAERHDGGVEAEGDDGVQQGRAALPFAGLPFFSAMPFFERDLDLTVLVIISIVMITRLCYGNKKWWRRRESNPHPKVATSEIYTFSLFT